jgi:hypothetical protein
MNREHPTCTERKPLNKECGWKGGDIGGLAEREKREKIMERAKKLLTGIGLLPRKSLALCSTLAGLKRDLLPQRL